MNICLVCRYNFHTFDITGGGRRIFLDVGALLASKGHKTALFCKRTENEKAQGWYEGMEIHRAREFNAMSKFGRRISSAVDLPFVLPLIANSCWRNYQVMMALDDPRPCLLPSFETKILNLHMSPSIIPSHTNRLLCRLRNIDLTICCSDFVANKTRTLAPYLSREAKIIYNGIDCRPFMKASGERVRRLLSIDSKTTVFLYVGQIAELKGLHVLVEAFRKTHESFPATSMIVVGTSKLWTGGWNTKQNELYERQVHERASGLPIYFVGLVSKAEIPEYYAAADIFVCPSIVKEAFPLVNLEAMASAKPVVATRVGGIPEAVLDGETGILVPPNEAQILAESLELLIREPRMRASLGKTGQDIVIRSFTKERMLNDYVKVFENV